MRAKAKYAVIYRHREQYPVSVMCRFFSVSRSGYYGFVKRMNRPEKDAALAETIRQQQDKCFHTYGYRRMWQWLKGSKRIYHNPKTILRVMKKYGLLAEIRAATGNGSRWPSNCTNTRIFSTEISKRGSQLQMGN